LWDNNKHFAMANDPEVPGHASLEKDADPQDPASYDRFCENDQQQEENDGS
jgi:hypothetical protein